MLSVTSNKALPQNEKQLWEQLDIEFDYKSIIFCTNCMKQLSSFSDHRNTCSNFYSGINSELIIFPIENELGTVIEINADFIKGYRPHDVCDVI